MTTSATEHPTPAERLAALVAGEPVPGPVLVAETRRADVEVALGPTGHEPDAVGRFGRTPAGFREYDEASIAPLGLTAWFDGDALLGVVVQLPDLPTAWVEALGPAERRDASPTGRAILREVWPDRGVVLHRHRATGEIERLDVLAAASVDLLDDERPPRREPRPPRHER